jgi:PAS domain S-box-containing protein
MKTLIVDDQREGIYLLERLLQRFGHETVSAQNGKEALEKLREHDFEMVISDILMPVMDGFQLCRAIKSDEKFKPLLFILYSSTYWGKEDEALAFKMGADQFIRKPLDPEEFMEMIRHLIEQVKTGQVIPGKNVVEDESEVCKLYNQRLINKLEEKMLALEEEVQKRRQAEEDLKRYFNQLEVLVEERTAELSRTNLQLQEEIAGRKKVEESLRQSEEKVKAQFKGVPIPTYIWQKTAEDFVLVDYNNAAEVITEGKISQFIGRKASEMYGDNPEILKNFRHCFIARAIVQQEMFYQFKTTDKEAYLMVSYAFVPPDLVLVHTRDISQRKRAEEALQAARDHLELQVEERTFALTKTNRQLQQEIADRKQAQVTLIKEKEKAQMYLDIAEVIIVVIKADQTVSLINKKGCEILGYRYEEMIGKNWFNEFLPEHDRERVKTGFSRLMAGVVEPVEYFENAVITKSGELRLIAWHNAIIKNQQGRIEGSLSSGVDITEQKQAQKLMIHTEKMMTVAGLAAGMAHEINNPLAGIIQATEVIQNRLAAHRPANQKAAEESGTTIEALNTYMKKRKITELVDTIKNCSKRAAYIVTSMLNFSRKSEAHFLPYDITELLENSITLAESEYHLKEKFDFHQVKVVREYAPGLPPLRCEGNQVQQVFLNLFKNAAQAMFEAQTPSPCIILRVQREEQMLRIEVKDNGPGMPEQIRKRVFEPFFTTKAVGHGTGLGLSVSYFIITENHRGKMEVESTPGQGTTFILHFPL